MKKRMSRGKKPVLTSPWKIGVFVSLLLVFMSVGVACYLMSVYHVRLAWLKTGSGGWGIDSSIFFKEAYPLLAGVLLISLISYFIVASGVRRYKFYLDSGQDYRRMISLAESVDDLTNPAQIARLSSYPELQSVLRGYGDQIREISQDLAQREQAPSYDGLLSQIESLLRGESIEMDTAAKGERTAILEKVRDHVESHRAQIEELQNRVESERRACARAALAYGRVVEAISGAGEGLLAITTSVGELTNAAETLSKRPGSPRVGGAEQQEKALSTIVTDMESSVRKLEEGGRVLHEFSEENNGIAINLALMAARGQVSEHDLATFAERVRSTAERFHKLSRTVSSIAQGLLGTCYALKEKIGTASPAASSGIDPGVCRNIVEIARRIEESSGTLQARICNIGSELHDVHEILQGNLPGGDEQGPESGSSPLVDAAHEGTTGASRERASVCADLAEEPSEFIIDHGKAWSGIGSGEPAIEEIAHPSGESAAPNLKEEDVPGEAVSAESPASEQQSDFSNISSLRELDSRDNAAEESGATEEQPRESESWMEMPGHRWLKIDVDKAEAEDDAGAVEVTVEPPAEESQDSEAVHDLYDLGAVEYVEEISAQR